MNELHTSSTYFLIQVWSESKHDFIGSASSIELLKSKCPEVADWQFNAVGGVTSKKTGLVIKLHS